MSFLLDITILILTDEELKNKSVLSRNILIVSRAGWTSEFLYRMFSLLSTFLILASPG